MLQNIFNARLNYEGGKWSLRSITGVMKTTSHRQFNQDLVQYSLYKTYGGRTGDTVSQEVRVNIERDSWDWTIGAFYSNDDADTYGVSPIGSDNFYVSTSGMSTAPVVFSGNLWLSQSLPGYFSLMLLPSCS